MVCGSARAATYICNRSLRIALIIAELYFDLPAGNAPGFVDAIPLASAKFLYGLDVVRVAEIVPRPDKDRDLQWRLTDAKSLGRESQCC